MFGDATWCPGDKPGPGVALLVLHPRDGRAFASDRSDYLLPQIGTVLSLWVGMVVSATILVSSFGFALSTLFPRQSTFVKSVGHGRLDRRGGDPSFQPRRHADLQPGTSIGIRPARITALRIFSSESLINPQLHDHKQGSIPAVHSHLENTMPELESGSFHTCYWPQSAWGSSRWRRPHSSDPANPQIIADNERQKERTEMELTIEHLGKRYGQHWALRELSLRCEPGMLGLVGPNGAGKTSLMRMIATLL